MNEVVTVVTLCFLQTIRITELQNVFTSINDWIMNHI